MTPTTIIREAQADGVRLSFTAAGTIKATGNGAAVNRWLAVIRERKPEIIEALKVGATDTALTLYWWRVHFSDRDPVELACCPEATHAEVLERYPVALAVEPFMPAARLPAISIAPDEEAAIRSWLSQIGEVDPQAIESLIDQCAQDETARMRILELTKRCCAWCRHHRRPGLTDVGYCTSRNDLPIAYGLLRQTPGDKGTSCANWQPIQAWGE